MTETTTQAPTMHYYRRGENHHDLTVNGAPDPRLFASDPETVAAVELMAKLVADRTANEAEAARLARAVIDDEQQHFRDVRAALADGRDVSKMTNPRPELERQLEDAQQRGRDLKRAIAAQGGITGYAIQGTAADVLDEAEARMAAVEPKIAELLAKLEPLLEQWQTARDDRFYLSRVALFGGNHRAVVRGPEDLGLAMIRDAIANDLARLKSDEANVRAFRGEH